jgi:hypothetical protein
VDTFIEEIFFKRLYLISKMRERSVRVKLDL